MKKIKSEIKSVTVTVTGIVNHDLLLDDFCSAERLECTIFNDNTGKTLSINDGKKQFTIPFEAVEKYLR